MLILPPGHAERVAQRRPFTRREKWIVSSVGALVVALVVALLISLGSSAPKSAHGCVYVSVASTMGAQPVSGCGATARGLCAQAGAGQSITGSLRRELLVACRRAGVPVGPA